MVRDCGEGIPEDKLRRIFEPFFTTKTGPDESGKGGTGLGLSTARDIIEHHHRRIRVESKLDEGSRFTLEFPAVVPQPTTGQTMPNVRGSTTIDPIPADSSHG